MNTKPLPGRRSHIYAATALALAWLTISLTSLTQAASLVMNGGFDDLTSQPTLSGTPISGPTVFGNLCGPGIFDPSRVPVNSQVCPTMSPVNGWTDRGLVAVFTPFSGPGVTPSGTSADSIGAAFKNFLPCTTNNPASLVSATSGLTARFGAMCSTPAGGPTTAGDINSLAQNQNRANSDGAFRLWGPSNNGTFKGVVSGTAGAATSPTDYTGNCPGCLRWGSPGAFPSTSINNLRNCNVNGNPGPNGCGANFIAMDADFNTRVSSTDESLGTFQGLISQPLHNLRQGATYDISFFWGGAQQAPRNVTVPAAMGRLTYQLLVGLCKVGESPGQVPGINTSTGPTGPVGTLGGPSSGHPCGFYSPVIDAANHGFTGWQANTATITANDPNDVLSFLALGTPNAEPPIILLDGVSMEQVSTPEPDTLSLLGICFAVIAGFAYWRPKWIRVSD